MTDRSEWVVTKEVADRLGVSQNTARKMLKESEVKRVSLQRAIRWNRREVEEWLKTKITR